MFSFTMMFVFVVVGAEAKKTLNLTIPILVPMTGDGPRIGEACKAAANIVFEEFNSRQDFLANYHVEPYYLNEGSGASLTPKQVLEFDRKAKSPIVIGPFFTPGCKALASFVHQIGMVQIAMSCGAPFLTAARKLYPNFNRVRSGGEFAAFPTLYFIKNVGKWHRFAILTWAGNIYNILIATFLQQQAGKNNVSVPYFDIVADIDDHAVISLQKSDIRIIALMVAENFQITKFLCLAYKHGITGPKYVFFLTFTGYVEPEYVDETPTCTREILRIQFSYAKWTGAQLDSDDADRPTTLGYNLKTFDTRFNSKMNGKRAADHLKRVICHDAALAALLTLDRAERSLNSLNQTLIDYKSTAKVVAESVLSLEYDSLRVGHAKYSKRYELDQDPQVIAQWTPSGLKVEHKVQLASAEGDPYSYNDYTFQTIEESTWSTANGKPPVEISTRRLVTLANLNEIAYTFWSLALLLSAVQVAYFALHFNRRFRAIVVEIGTLLFSCIFFNASAAIFATDLAYQLCIVQPIVVVFSLTAMVIFLAQRIIACEKALFVSSITLRVVDVSTLSTQHATLAKHRSKSPNRTEPVFVLEEPPIHHARKEKKNYGTLALALPSVLTLLAWLAADPMTAERYQIRTFSDVEHDTIVTEQVLACHSAHFIPFLMSIAGYHAVILIVFILWIFKISTQYHNFTRHVAMLTPTKLYLANVTSLYFASLLIVAVLGNSIGQNMTVACVSLIISLVSSFITFYYHTKCDNF